MEFFRCCVQLVYSVHDMANASLDLFEQGIIGKLAEIFDCGFHKFSINVCVIVDVMQSITRCRLV